MLFKKSPAIEGFGPLISYLPVSFVVVASWALSISLVIRSVRRRLHERCEPFQVLNDCSQMELIASAGEAPQSHALEPMMGL